MVYLQEPNEELSNVDDPTSHDATNWLNAMIEE